MKTSCGHAENQWIARIRYVAELRRRRLRRRKHSGSQRGKIMATDVEESDRISPKRQRTLVLTNSDGFGESQFIQVENEKKRAEASTSNEPSEEVCIRWKLLEWQALQVKTAFVDNAINEMLEVTSSFPHLEYTRLNGLIRNSWLNHTENEGVMMAIRNYGLVCLTHADSQLSQTQAILDDVSRSYQDTKGHIFNWKPLTRLPKPITRNNIETTNSSTSSLDRESMKETSYDSDQRQDFMERAVDEAIKKKGLSALTVDYG